MAAKVFEVGDVLPATTQLRISWFGDITSITNNKYILTADYSMVFVWKTNTGALTIAYDYYYEEDYVETITHLIYHKTDGFMTPYTNASGDHAYVDIDTSTWDLDIRTIASVDTGMDIFTWEDLNAPSCYTISFNSNGGTTFSDIEEATELPSELPIPTKSGYTFVNWYYDSAFTQIANPGDTIESNVTLYAKWQLNTYTITFESNGGSSVSQISNATQLPSELPIPTKARNTFVGWYYDSTLKQKAKPNDTINTNVTLYAKWYDSLSAFYTDIANLIREFENSGDNIKVTDFADRLRALLESV